MHRSAPLRFPGAFAGHRRTARSSQPPFDWPVAQWRCRFTAGWQRFLRCGPDIESRVRPRSTGVLKNALDWVVGSGELVDKPIALINASGRATHAWASLAETLSVMSAQVIVEASITIPLDGRRLDANGIVYDAELSTALRSAIESLADAARVTRGA